MKTLTKTEHLSDINDFLTRMITVSLPIICWQTNADGKKAICPIFVRAVDESQSNFTIQNAQGTLFPFDANAIYFFHSTEKIIFKCNQSSTEEDTAVIEIPEEVKFITDEEVTTLGTSLGMEDGLKDFEKLIKGHGLGNQQSDLSMVSGEGRANSEEENTFVPGDGSANIDESQHMVLRTENATDKIETNRAGQTSTDHMSTMTSSKTSTEHMNTMTSSKASNEKLSTSWHVKSMSVSDAALFEQELSFVTLDEEDKIFEGKRTTPRARPPEGKMVTVQVGDESRVQSTHPLHDLSQGGFAFLVFSKEEFASGEVLHIKAFDTNKFDDPMVGKVMAVREADDMGIQYKVGCQFVHEDPE
jgi:hypothetical protein